MESLPLHPKEDKDNHSGDAAPVQDAVFSSWGPEQNPLGTFSYAFSFSLLLLFLPLLHKVSLP